MAESGSTISSCTTSGAAAASGAAADAGGAVAGRADAGAVDLAAAFAAGDPRSEAKASTPGDDGVGLGLFGLEPDDARPGTVSADGCFNSEYLLA